MVAEEVVVDVPNLLRRAEMLRTQIKETNKMSNGLRMRVDGIQKEFQQIHTQIMALHGGHPDEQKNNDEAEATAKESPNADTDVRKVQEDQTG